MASFNAAKIEQLLDALNEKRAKSGKSALELEADGVHVRLENGALATWKPQESKDGKQFAKWVIVQGADNAYMSKIRTPKGQTQKGKPLSREDAEKAFNRYYARRDYLSPRARKAAMSRDRNSSPKDSSRIVETTRYLRNPGRYDYPGVDAGERVSKATGNLAALAKARASPRSPRRSHREVLRGVHHATEAQKAAAKAYRASRKAAKAMPPSLEGGRQQQQRQQQQRQQQQRQQQQQQGGRAVSLKTAVKLLRNYYSNRYQ